MRINDRRLVFVSILTIMILAGAGAYTVAALGSSSEVNYVIGDQKTPVVMPAKGATYVGAEQCKMCHFAIYENWATTGHKYKLMTPDEALQLRPDLPMPEGYTKDDILYVIGSWGWKARYVGMDGYIITKTGPGKNKNGTNQYNIATGEWADYNPGQVVKYNCQRCHNTGASYDRNTPGLPGIEGTWEFRGIQCEACHGPGSEHIKAGGGKGVGIIVDTNSSMCGLCHRRGEDDAKIPAGGGFVQHHEQYQDFLAAGKMSDLKCVTCHDPHKPVYAGATNPIEGAGIRKVCTDADCHAETGKTYNGSVMGIAGVTCIDCHMPKTVKSAVAESQYVADVRSHVFKINTDVDAEFTYIGDDGKEYANPYLTVEYMCLSCHSDKDKAWAAENAPGSMSLMPGTTKDEGVPEKAQGDAKTPGIGVLGSTAILGMVYIFRKMSGKGN